MAQIICSQCKRPYPSTGTPYICPDCSGIYDFNSAPLFDPDQCDLSNPGIWRYRQTFDLKENAPLVTLGEGNTPLLWDEVNGHKLGFKLEYLNPTGSYKDRGSAVLISQLLARDVKKAVEDSSGNAGASFAAYSARAGISATVFVPESAAGPKRIQIERYGANLIRIPGPRSAAAQAVLEAVKAGAVYASHAYLPFGLSGIATIAYELWEEMGDVPGTIIAPVGHGGLLLGIVRGYAALYERGFINKLPFYIGVQARACAPLWSMTHGMNGAPHLREEDKTIAEGVRVNKPVRAQALINEIRAGEFLAIDEEEILPAQVELARRGFYIEPTSALVWSGLKLLGNVEEPVIMILTGSGLKYLPS